MTIEVTSKPTTKTYLTVETISGVKAGHSLAYYYPKEHLNNYVKAMYPLKVRIGEVIAIFWTINDPPGLQGLKNRLFSV